MDIYINILKRKEIGNSFGNDLAPGVKETNDNIWETYVLTGDIFKVLLPIEYNIGEDLRIEMTSDYLVLTCIDTILCVSLKDIETANNDDINGLPYIERLHEKGLIKAKYINISEMFDSETIEAGLFVNVVSKTQL
jgi:hypothetical protein